MPQDRNWRWKRCRTARAGGDSKFKDIQN